jgi:hypothetical protein
MTERMTDAEIADLARRLASVLAADEQGTSSWWIARARLGRQLHEALGAALGEPTNERTGT